MRYLAKAKVNLTLDVIGKLPNGFHRIKSIVLKIPLFDEIEIEEGNGEVIFLNENIKENNTVSLSIKLFFEKVKEKPNISVRVVKNIPVGSGLGGGSSDASVVLNALNSIYGFKLSSDELLEIASKVGSDVPLFIREENLLLIENRGEKVMPIYVKDREFFIAVIFPGFKVSTKEVYSMVNEYSYFNPSTDTVLERLIEGKEFLSYLKNDLERFAFKVKPELIKIKEKIKEFKPVSIVLSGSGSSFVAFFKNPKNLFLLKEELKRYQIFLFHVLGWERIYRIDRQTKE